MPSAAGRIDEFVSAAAVWGRADEIASTGRPQPITPVELGRIWFAEKPRRRAVSAQIRSLASTPPGAQTFEILLFTMIAPSVGSSSRLRPTITGAPGNAFFV